MCSKSVLPRPVVVRAEAPGRAGRVVVATNLGSRWFFVYGFEKNERANIDDRELAAFQQLAGVLLRLDGSWLASERELGNLTEICHEETKSNSH